MQTIQNEKFICFLSGIRTSRRPSAPKAGALDHSGHTDRDEELCLKVLQDHGAVFMVMSCLIKSISKR